MRTYPLAAAWGVLGDFDRVRRWRPREVVGVEDRGPVITRLLSDALFDHLDRLADVFASVAGDREALVLLQDRLTDRVGDGPQNRSSWIMASCIHLPSAAWYEL